MLWKTLPGRIEQAGVAMKWVTRARPKTGRIAWPRLIRRFIDPDAEALYVPPDRVLRVRQSEGAQSFDAPDAEFTDRAGNCTVEILIDDFEPGDNAGAAGPAGVDRRRRGAWMLAGSAGLVMLVALTATAVVVSRSDGSRPRGKVVSDHTTAPTTTAPVATTAPRSEERRVGKEWTSGGGAEQ